MAFFTHQKGVNCPSDALNVQGPIRPGNVQKISKNLSNVRIAREITRQCPRFPKPAGRKNYRAKLMQKSNQNSIDTSTRTQPPLSSRKVSSELSYAEISA
ncbi:hypothetical protein AVEN_16645-1 [Araneus ventricosus]|uniref:Uncharacterized protein n=1 Tax=Araneus ventricosus TaxID=182803 RepID=A0A4Y2L234_ARAVE|nr:hypothetical protein AVEN_16645-1 [Araneus ventricosus]